MDGPNGLHFVTHLVPKLDMLKPLDLLAGDYMCNKVQAIGTGPSVYFIVPF
ncbi:hypothetical protein Hanom_Chr02g00155161 [Helianthus anomalus]